MGNTGLAGLEPTTYGSGNHDINPCAHGQTLLEARFCVIARLQQITFAGTLLRESGHACPLPNHPSADTLQLSAEF